MVGDQPQQHAASAVSRARKLESPRLTSPPQLLPVLITTVVPSLGNSAQLRNARLPRYSQQGTKQLLGLSAAGHLLEESHRCSAVRHAVSH